MTDMEEKLQSPPLQPQSTPNIDALLARLSQTGGYDLEKVKKALETTPNLVVCVSEGINDGNGTFICEFASDVGVDTFGHKMLTGSGKYLENLIKEAWCKSAFRRAECESALLFFLPF